MDYDWLKHHDHDWLKLSDFESACRFFDDVRSATHFKVLMHDKTYIVTRARLEELAKSPDADRIVYWPIQQP